MLVESSNGRIPLRNRIQSRRPSPRRGEYGIAGVRHRGDGRRLRPGEWSRSAYACGAFRQRIEKVVISGDGRRVAALSNDWELAVFDKVSGALLGIAEAPEGYFTDNAAVALSADGTRLVCSAGTEARLWEIPTDADLKSGKRTGRLVSKWKVPPALTEAAGFRADGRLILIRQETRDQQRPPSENADPKDHPRVCRAYELREQSDPKLLTAISRLRSVCRTHRRDSRRRIFRHSGHQHEDR